MICHTPCLPRHTHTHIHQARRLEKHINMISAGCAIHKILNGNDDQGSLQDHLQVLLDNCVDLPQSVRQRLLARHLRQIIPSLSDDSKQQAVVSEVVSALSPFGTRSAAGCLEGGESETFDLERPTMSQLKGDLALKTSLTRKILTYDVYKVLVENGEASSVAALRLTRGVLELYERHLEDIDELPEAMEATVQMCRAMETLLDAGMMVVADADVQRLYQSGLSGKQSTTADLALMLQMSPFYETRMREFMQAFATSKLGMARMRRFMDSITRSSTNFPGHIECTKSGLEALDELKAQLRPGATYKLEHLCQEAIDKQCSVLKRRLDDLDDKKALDDARRFISMLDVALQVWPAAPDLLDMHSFFRAAIAKQVMLERQNALFEALDACVLEDGEFNAFATALAACEGMELSSANGMEHDRAKQFILSGIRLIVMKTPHFPDITDMMLSLCRCLPTAFVSCENLLAKVRCAKAVVELRLAFDHYDKLGETPEARVTCDEGLKMLTTIMQRLACIDPNLIVLEGAGEALTKQASKAIGDAKEVLVKNAVDDMVSTAEETMQWSRGGEGDQPWHASLSEDATLEEVLGVARTTLLKSSSKQYSEAAETVQGKLTKYMEIIAMFDLRPDPDAMCKAEAAMQAAMLSYFEGLLCVMFNTLTDPMALKKKVRALKDRLVATRGLGWADLQPQLEYRASKALILK